VLSGTARFVIAADTVEAQTGTFVHVPAGVMRTAFAEEAGTTVLAIGGGREGEPYRPGGWEVWSPLRPLMQAGRHEELVARARPLLDDGPPTRSCFTTLPVARVCSGAPTTRSITYVAPYN
jgi:hypothetical protein